MIWEFASADEMYIHAATTASTYGVNTEHGLEFYGYAARLNNPYCGFIYNPNRMIAPDFAAARLIWYLSGEDEATSLLPYVPTHTVYTGEDIISIGKRWANFHQLGRLIQLLQLKPDSKQAVMTCWYPQDLQQELSPATLNFHFMIRGGKLNLIVNMRSNDLWHSMPYDIFCFTSLQIMVAAALHIPVGFYQHQVGCLYSSSIEDVRKVAYPPVFNIDALWYQQEVDDVPRRIKEMVMVEAHNRKHETNALDSDALCGGEYSIFNQILLMTATKWNERADKRITNPQLAKYIEKYRMLNPTQSPMELLLTGIEATDDTNGQSNSVGSVE